MKNLTLCVALDDAGGMTFCGKRQSRDRVMLSEMFATFGTPIYVAPYSVSILTNFAGKYVAADNPASLAPSGGVVFLERGSVKAIIDDVETLVIYRWNRKYPSDGKIDIDLSEWCVERATEFVGSSHDKITKITMKRR